ncbi:DUF1592 domain-containing protein [Sorangium sp. So ce1036]|uniref:DUF1592 domain-containing protein n=1 Tax=Sorangium sp. So ce1036 TaxID=3133328 RepID=UPI003F08BFC9
MCRRYAAVALLLAGPLGCLGNLGDLDGTPAGGDGSSSSSGGDSGSSSGPGGGETPIGEPPEMPHDIPEVSACMQADNSTPGPRMVRRLSVQQFEATVRDLFRDPSVDLPSIFNDPHVLGFASDANALVIRDLTASQIMDWAESTADWAVTNKLGGITSVTCRTTDEACRRQFITDFGRRAFREPLAEDRVAAYDALFAAESSFEDGAKVVVGAMLQSPYFLYRREIGSPDPSNPALFNLGQHEIASNLSYLLTGSMPDDTLLQAADQGQLSTPEQIDAQAQRLLQDPRAQEELMRFMRGWLQLNRLITTVKDPALYDLPDALRQDMMNESRALIMDVAFNPQNPGTFSDLLTASYTFLNSNLAQHYGMGGAGGPDFTRVDLSGGQRDKGILAHGSFLAGHAGSKLSSPTQRGKMIRTRLLCQPLEPPPPGVDPNIKIPETPATTREMVEQHTEPGFCHSCHIDMDPIGLGFEHYDAIGRWRDQENGIAIDSSGEIVEPPSGENFVFDGVNQLADYLAASEDVKDCMIRHWSYYAFGDTWNEDGCTYEAARQEAEAGNFALKSVWLALARVPHFTRRVQDP